MNINSNNNIFSKINLNKRDLIIFLIPLIIFSGYLFVYNPGILTYDSYNQLHQIATGNFDNWHPFFHTFIEMILLKIYANPIIIPIVQILTFTTIWTAICKYNRNDNQHSSKNFKIQVLITLIIAIIPINAVYAITLWKDVLFSYLILLLCFLIQILLDNKGQIDIKFAVLISVVMAFASQLRPNGLIIILPVLIIIAIYLFRKNKSSKLYIAIPAITIIVILLISSLSMIYDVEDTQKDAVFSKTMHLLADYDLNLNLDEADREKIHEVINETAIKENYNIYFTDHIRDASNQDVYDSDKAAYISMAIKYSLQNPIHFIKYMLGSSPMVWHIVRDDAWNGDVYYINDGGPHMSYAKDKYYTTHNTQPAANFDNATSANEGTGKFALMNSIVFVAKDNTLLDTVFDSPALYMYLAILAMAGIYLLTKSKGVLLIYLPNFLNILSVFLSTPTQDNRYLYANLLVFYLLLTILLKCYLEYTGENTPSPSKPQYIEKPQPRLIEEINYDDIYLTEEPSNNDEFYLNENTKEQVNYEPQENIYNVRQPQREETPEEMEERITAEILKELEEQGYFRND